MKSELTIYKKWKMQIYGFAVILLVQSMAFLMLYMLLKEFNAQSLMRNIIILVILAIYFAVDMYFLYDRIYLTKRLMNKEPMRCILEDIFLIPSKEDGKKRYAPYPIVRSIHDNKLYLAYGNYSLMNFTARFNYSDRKNIYCTLYKLDGRPVVFGEMVDIYVLKNVNVSVDIRESKNTVKLKGRKFYFYHVNDKMSIDVFRKINFFKGIIDLDAGICDISAK